MNPKLLQLIGLAAMFGGPPPVRRDTPVADENEDFHGHLDRCRQCRDHPFGLCVTGERLLKRDAAKMDGSTTGHPGGEDSRHNDGRMHHYQRRRTSITGLKLKSG